ncbi:hypothetical protein [Microbacterium saperdae]|uniref:Flp pilus assembly pilin Flp n=1 Tax=Microbacterium saperdae TaxID=69368 RepID=A0A543BKM7_9MICO|nr:hypothetical protein [Microbacterium saperdae]TQL85385.1 hypothetical protein FB560_0993 [Microbacterium saperdae]GGM54666.1 hypothetical protein GCM10010489_27830 [Microbacterium saperdae]
MTTLRRRRTDATIWLRDLAEDERGDVPGWVLVTLMTAGLVVLIWAVAGPALSALFEQAIQRVSGL